MHRIGAILIVLLLLTANAFAQYELDTLSHRFVGPGMVHTHVIEPNRPWNIHIFTADLTNPYLEIESVKANDRVRGLERTSLMAARLDAPGYRVVGGVNGDFYGGAGEPISIQIARGEVIKREAEGRTAVGFGPENRPMMGVVSFSGELFTADDAIVISDINSTRGSDQLILYNSYMGSSTGTNQYGTELSMEVIDPWVVNDTLRAVVGEVETGVGDMAIPDGHIVFSGHGTAAQALEAQFEVGDTLAFLLNVQPSPGLLEDMVGGGPFILVDGQIDVGPRGDGDVRHPRTAVGFSADSTKLILATVDGRQSISVGMTLYELATLMQQAGATTAMNLDGGGSTTMLVRGEVMNSPSDGSERPVSNSLLVYSTAPVGELDDIRLADRMIRLFRGTTYQVRVEGIDAFYNPIPLDSALLSFEADPEIGTIDENGMLQAPMTADSGYVRVAYAGHVDSMQVIVKDIGRIALDPQSVLADTLQTITFSVAAFDTDNIRRSVPPAEFAWTSTNETVGMVDDQGRFRGGAPGVTSIVVSYRDLADTAQVTVEVHDGFTIIDSLEVASTWSVTAENADLDDDPLVAVDTVVTLGSHALALTYRFTPTQDASIVHLNRTLDVPGIPDSIHVDIRSEVSGHRLFFEAIDGKGDTYTFYPPGRRPDLPTENVGTVAAPFQSPGMLHPIRFTRIGIQLSKGDGSDEVVGTIHFDNLRVSYPGHTGTAIVAEELPAGEIALHPNYPNPFAERTRLTYDLGTPEHVTLQVFDLLGRLVRTVEEGPRSSGRHEIEFDAAGLPSGLYFVRLNAGGVVKSRAISIIH